MLGLHVQKMPSYQQEEIDKKMGSIFKSRELQKGARVQCRGSQLNEVGAMSEFYYAGRSAAGEHEVDGDIHGAVTERYPYDRNYDRSKEGRGPREPWGTGKAMARRGVGGGQERGPGDARAAANTQKRAVATSDKMKSARWRPPAFPSLDY